MAKRKAESEFSECDSVGLATGDATVTGVKDVSPVQGWTPDTTLPSGWHPPEPKLPASGWTMTSNSLNLHTLNMVGGFAELLLQFQLPATDVKQSMSGACAVLSDFQTKLSAKLMSLPEFTKWTNLKTQLDAQHKDSQTRRDEVQSLESEYDSILSSGDAGLIERTRRRLHESKLYLNIIADDVSKLERLVHLAAFELRKTGERLSNGGERIAALERAKAAKAKTCQAITEAISSLLCELVTLSSAEAELSSLVAIDFAKHRLTQLGVPTDLRLPPDTQTKDYTAHAMLQAFGDKPVFHGTLAGRVS
jgi:hypothetical protein